MMEFQLRNFQTLTEGSRVTLTYELNRYTLKVLECKPAKGTRTHSLSFYPTLLLSPSLFLSPSISLSSGISILDADITTDIVEPADLTRYVR